MKHTTRPWHSILLGVLFRVLQVGFQQERQLTPNLVRGSLVEERVVGVSLGFEHSGCVTESGHVYTWGNNYYGRLGLGDENNRYSPTLVRSDGCWIESNRSSTETNTYACSIVLLSLSFSLFLSLSLSLLFSLLFSLLLGGSLGR